MIVLEESTAAPFKKSRCRDSPLKLLLETKGGSTIAFECKKMLKSKNTWCSETVCSLHAVPKSAGCVQCMVVLIPKEPSVAKTCRTTCNFCASDDDESNQPSIELRVVPSAAPSFESNQPSIKLSGVSSAVPSFEDAFAPSHQPSSEPTFAPSHQPSPVPTNALAGIPGTRTSCCSWAYD